MAVNVGLVPFCDLDLGFGHSIMLMPRDYWGGQLPEYQEAPRLRLPVSRVRFAYTGCADYSCSTARECVQRVQALQRFHKDIGHSDLPYKSMYKECSFIVGGDRRVYVVGGWESDMEKDPKHEWLKGKTISIAYLGDYKVGGPPYEMMWTAMDLVKYGLKEKIIHPLFRLVPSEGPSEE